MAQRHLNSKNHVRNIFDASEVLHHFWSVPKVCTMTIIMAIAIYPKKLIASKRFAKHPDRIWFPVTKIVLGKWNLQLEFGKTNVCGSKMKWLHRFSYYQCVNFIPTPYTCSADLYYNHLTQMCDLKSKVPCIMIPDISSEEDDYNGDGNSVFDCRWVRYLIWFCFSSWNIMPTNRCSLLSPSVRLSAVFLMCEWYQC